MSDPALEHHTGADAPPTTTTGPALVYVAWRADRSRRLDTGAPSVGKAADFKCPLCPDPLGDTEPVQLLAVGPDTPATRQQHDAGKAYRAAGTVAHQLCVQRVPDEALDRVAAALLASIAGGTDG